MSDDDNPMPDRLGPYTNQWSADCNAVMDGPVSAPARLCGQPAVMHYLVSDAGDNVLACVDHARDAGRLFDVQDRHEPTATCVMPNALWDVQRRCCYVEGLEFDLTAELSATPELVEAAR